MNVTFFSFKISTMVDLPTKIVCKRYNVMSFDTIVKTETLILGIMTKYYLLKCYVDLYLFKWHKFAVVGKLHQIHLI